MTRPRSAGAQKAGEWLAGTAPSAQGASSSTARRPGDARTSRKCPALIDQRKITSRPAPGTFERTPKTTSGCSLYISKQAAYAQHKQMSEEKGRRARTARPDPSDIKVCARAQTACTQTKQHRKKLSKIESYKRRRPDLNRCILVLQTIALPLGYCAESDI